MKICLDETEIRVEVNISFGGIGISHEEPIFTLSEKVGVYGRGNSRGSVLVRGYNAFYPGFESMM